jgi:hypothetical protein
MSDTATTSSLQVRCRTRSLVAEVSCLVMEEPGASPLKRSLQRMAQIGADLSAAIHGHREVALVRRTTRPHGTTSTTTIGVAHLTEEAT